MEVGVEEEFGGREGSAGIFLEVFTRFRIGFERI